MNYYNENDQRAAAWLRVLIAEKIIPAGDVDTRSIVAVSPSDLRGYTQCHFFAGVGGWSHALRLANWSHRRRVWSGSCPCQPFSQLGKQECFNDERHLWPVFFELIRQCAPSVVFGEQVANKNGLVWLARVRADLEEAAYAVGATDLCAAGIGSPQKRQRIYWVAYTDRSCSGKPRDTGRAQASRVQSGADLGGRSSACGLVYADASRLQGHGGNGDDGEEPRWFDALAPRPTPATGIARSWDQFDLCQCKDGKKRRVEPGTFPLADGFPERVGLLRGYGNAIVPELAAEFIQACEEARALVCANV